MERQPLLSKKNMGTRLRFAMLNLNKPQDVWNNVLWADDVKVEMFSHIWWKAVMPLSVQIPHTNRQARWWRGWGFGFGPGHLAVTPLYTEVLWSQMWSIYLKQKLGRNWAIQQDNNVKQKRKEPCIVMARTKFKPQPEWNALLQTLMNWSNLANKSGPKILHKNVGTWKGQLLRRCKTTFGSKTKLLLARGWISF